MGLADFINSIFDPEEELPTGLQAFTGKGWMAGHRYHLRIDSERKGVLLIDASKMIFLNGTAVVYVLCILEEKKPEEVVKYVKRFYKKVAKEEILADHKAVKKQLKTFLGGDESVIEIVGAKSNTPGADELEAPYRLDLALTYKCQNKCHHCYNEEKRKKKSLEREDWIKVINAAWEQGIPHIVFTGGEPTMMPFLGKLIEQSEENGQITGLITNGRELAKKGYLEKLIFKGLDHVQITLLSTKPRVHDKLVGAKGAWEETVAGIKIATEADIYLSTNTTLMKANKDEVMDLIQFLHELGVKNVAFNSLIRSGKGKNAEGLTYEELEKLLFDINVETMDRNMNFTWYSPTLYCDLNPVNLGLGIKQCTACSINMAVEPDGTVLPCQSYYKELGNILEDPWIDIWEHSLCKKIRERGYVDAKCKKCDLLKLCGGGCPLDGGVCQDASSSM